MALTSTTNCGNAISTSNGTVLGANAEWADLGTGMATTYHYMAKQKALVPHQKIGSVPSAQALHQTNVGQTTLVEAQRTKSTGHDMVAAIGRANCIEKVFENDEHQQPFRENKNSVQERQQGKAKYERHEEQKDAVPSLPFRRQTLSRTRSLLLIPATRKPPISTSSSKPKSKHALRSESLSDLFALKKNTRKTSAAHSPSESKFLSACTLDRSVRAASGNNSPTKRRRDAESSPSPTSFRRINGVKSDGPEHRLSPQATLLKLLILQGHDAVKKPALSMTDGYFRNRSDGEVASYGRDLIMAVRNRDVGMLRGFLREGRHKSLHSCNKFGESIIHMACRQGFFEVVHFLMKEAGVTLRVRDDYGRTPLHDACWTCEPNFDLLEMMLREEPEMLLIRDNRGRAPLEYVRKEHWHGWIMFLEERQDLICQSGAGRPKEMGYTPFRDG